MLRSPSSSSDCSCSCAPGSRLSLCVWRRCSIVILSISEGTTNSIGPTVATCPFELGNGTKRPTQVAITLLSSTQARISNVAASTRSMLNGEGNSNEIRAPGDEDEMTHWSFWGGLGCRPACTIRTSSSRVQ